MESSKWLHKVVGGMVYRVWAHLNVENGWSYPLILNACTCHFHSVQILLLQQVTVEIFFALEKFFSISVLLSSPRKVFIFTLKFSIIGADAGRGPALSNTWNLKLMMSERDALVFPLLSKKTFSSPPAGCCWTWSRGSVKPGTTSALSDGPQRKRREGEDEGFGRDGLTGWQEKDGDYSLHRQSHWVLVVPAEASVSLQSSYSEMWTVDPGQWWQSGEETFLGTF